MIKLVDLDRQEASISDEILSAISETVERRDFILGKALSDFENHFASYIGTQYAIGTGSGGSALTIALRALNVGPGDEVITQPNSHASTAFAALYLGARPVFVDVDPDTFQIDPQKVEAAVTPRTKVIIPVHIYGYAAPLQQIGEIAERYKVAVVEDAAHACGTLYHGRRCGSMALVSAFSFYPGKNLGCWGDGGAVVTDNEAIAEQARVLRTYGDKKKNYHAELGINSRLDTIQAAILDVKLKQLDDRNRQRRLAAAWYRWLFHELRLDQFVVLPPLELPGQQPNFHLFVIQAPAEKREALYEYLHSNGIECGLHYPVPIHLQPVTASLGYRVGAFPVAERLAQTVLSLPMYGGLTEGECRQVVQWIKKFFDRS